MSTKLFRYRVSLRAFRDNEWIGLREAARARVVLPRPHVHEPALRVLLALGGEDVRKLRLRLSLSAVAGKMREADR